MVEHVVAGHPLYGPVDLSVVEALVVKVGTGKACPVELLLYSCLTENLRFSIREQLYRTRLSGTHLYNHTFHHRKIHW